MERKEYDLFANLLSNLQSSIDGLITSGLSVDNTSLQDKSIYENNDEVRELFKDQNGEFDLAKFDAFYNDAKIVYNYMAQTSYDEAIKNQATFHRNNMFVEPEKRRQGPDFIEMRGLNPYKTTEGLITPGLLGLRTLSEDEIMLANKVLLNPTTAGENLENAQWGEAPNNHFWGYLDDVLVQARYEEEGTHKDPFTGEMIKHQVGELKIDDTGNFYYETLDGRDIYGKKVLNKMNILTVDGSWANQLDFFDSDDLNLKSVMGSVMKNLALVGSMWLPYVGPWIAGISIATLMAGLLGTLGKMATMDSNSPTFSFLEGWAKSVSRQNLSTEYAQQHPWCVENMINLIGDVFGLLSEQRMIFTKVPALFKGAGAINKTNENARKTELIDKYTKLLKTELETLEKNGASKVDLLKFSLVLNNRAVSMAQAEMDSFIKGYNKLGEILSRGYMTGITVGDTYGEAKAAGASDIDATLLTLGYAIGEYQLLKTGLGRWNLPETRLDTYRNLAIVRALYTAKNETKNVASTATKEGKKNYVRRLLTAGKNAFNDVWTASKANGSKTLSATLTSAAAEGVEEVSEELLADFSKGCYDVVKWLQGEDIRLNTFGYDFARGEWNGTEIRDRYLLSLIGGAVGGGLANVVTNYNMIDSYNSMKREDAVLQLVYMARNGGLDEFMKDVYKMNIDNPNLSTNFEVVDGQVVYDPGTKLNNRDLNIKRIIEQLVNIILEIMAANGAVSDNQFLDAQTLGDLRFAILQKSTTAGAYIQEYNSLLTQIAKETLDLKALASRDLDTNKDGVVSDAEKTHGEVTEDTKLAMKRVKDSLNEKKKKLDDLVSGKRSLEFIATSLWEVSTFLSGNFNKLTLPLFAELKYGKKFSELTNEEINKAKEEYDKWKPTLARDDLRTMALTFLEFEKLFSSVVKNHELTYLQNSEKARLVMEVIDKLNRLFLYVSDNKLIPNLLERYNKKENLMTDQMSILASELISIFGDEVLNEKLDSIKKRRKEAEKNITEETTEEERNAIHHPFNVELTLLVYDVIEKNIHNYAQEIINNGFANKEVKNQLVSLILEVHKLLLPLEQERENEIANNFELDAINEWRELRQSLINDIRAIERLNNTPIEQNLNEFAISIGRDPINITLLIEKLNLSFNETTDNVSNFLVNGLEQELANAIWTMELYATAIKAARTDNANLDNLFGFNATLNEVSSKVEGAEKLNLAEIDKNVADLFLEDIRTNLNKLELLGRIHALNKGLKLSKQERVSNKKDILMYKRMKYFVLILDDLEDIDEESVKLLKSILETLTLHELLLNENKTTVQDLETFLKENIAIENAIFDFFLSNQVLLTDSNKLAQLLSPSKLGLYTNAEELLNEELESIDDNSFVWWIASRAAIKAEDFYFQYEQIINPDAEKPKAPIATLELAIYNNYASIVNGNVFNTFYKAMRLALSQDWTNRLKVEGENKDLILAERKRILKNMGKSEIFADPKFDKYCLNFLPVPRYSNVILTEGIPGSGKSEAVFGLTVQLLKKFNRDVLKNVVIAHGANPDSAKGLAKNIDIENAQTFGHNELMKFISPKWKEYTKDEKTNKYNVPVTDYEINSENDIRSKLSINETMLNPPSLIIIDEISKFTSYDLDLIDKFAQKYGITVLVAGDFDQTGVVGLHNIPQDHVFDGTVWEIDLLRTNFVRSPKLGVSMRTDNMLKTNNLIKTLLFLQDFSGVLELEYAENEEGLFGDKLIPYTVDAAGSDKDNLLQSILKEVDKIAATLKEGEKIGYITNNTNSELHKALKARNDIDVFEGGSAQGLEGRYYIIDIEYNYDSKDSHSFLRDIYTGISRAQQGSLIIVSLSGEVPKINSTLKNEVPIKEDLGKPAIANFAKKRKEILKKVATNGKVSLILPRTSVRPTNPPVAPPSEGGLDEGVDLAALDAALLAAMDEEKQNLILAIGQALNQVEIDLILTNSKYAQLSTDSDILAARTARLEALNQEAIEHLNFIQGILTSIANANTIEELDTIINNNPDILNDANVETAYNDKKSKIESNIQELLDYITNVIEQLNSAETIDDLNALITISELEHPGISDDALVKSAYNNAKLIIETKNQQIPDPPLVTIEDDEIDDVSPVTDKDIIEPEKLQEDIDDSNEDKLLPIITIGLAENGQPIPINMLFLSFNSFETGVDEDEEGNVVLIGTPEQIAKRIDSVNGLIKIFDYLGIDLSGYKLKDYVNLIGEFRSIIFNTRNKAEIEEKIREKLGLSNIYSTFAFKSVFKTGENFETDEFGYPKSKSTPFNKSISEQSIGNGSSGARSKETNPKQLVLIIGTRETGNILELPLLTLSSPFTILLAKGPNGDYPFSAVFNTFKELANQLNPNWLLDLNSSGESGLKLAKIALGIITKHENDILYKELIDLFKLFLITDNFVKYIRDPEWTPARDLKPTGAHVTKNKGYYQIASGLRFNDITNPKDEWIHVADFAGVSNSKNELTPNKLNRDHNTQSTVTLIFLTAENTVIDGVTIPIKKGHPFVLVSYDKSLEGDVAIIEQYFKLVKDPNEPKSVVLMYISCPTATVAEYCDLIEDFINKKRPDISIGYFTTTFKLLKGLIEDNDPNKPINLDNPTVKLINRKLGNLAPKLLETLHSIPYNSSIDDLKRILKETRDWSREGLGNGPKTLYYLFRGALRNLAIITDTETGARSKDIEAILLLESEAKRLGINLYHHFPIPKNDHNSNKYFILPNPQKDYMLDRKPCLIHGKVDSYTFTGSMAGFISEMLLELKLNPSGHYYNMDTIDYLKIGNTSVNNYESERHNAERLLEINNIISRVKNKTGIDIDPNIFEGKSITEAKIEIANTINSSNGKNIAFVVSSDLRITDANDNLQGSNKIIYYNGLPITDVSTIILANGEAAIQISVDGKIYQGVIYKNEGKIEIIELNLGTPSFELILPTLGIKPETFTEYLNEGKTLLEPVFDADEDLKYLFEATTYDEFVLRLLEIDVMEADEDVPNSISYRIDMLNMLAIPQTDLLRLILNDLVEVEKSKKQGICPDVITILF